MLEGQDETSVKLLKFFFFPFFGSIMKSIRLALPA